MKKVLGLFIVFTVMFCTSQAQAGLDFHISFPTPVRIYQRHCDYEGPAVRYYDEAPRYYRPRRRVVTYYSEPVYYSQPRYSYYNRGCR